MQVNLELKKQDLNQYGECFEIKITEPNSGKTVTVRIQEHEFEHIKNWFGFNNPEKYGQFERNEIYH